MSVATLHLSNSTSSGGDVGELILFLVPAEVRKVHDHLRATVKAALRSKLSPRHVPDSVYEIESVPRTLSGKKLEVPVKRILTGVPIGEVVDPAAVSNPESLTFFRDVGAGKKVQVVG
ncbi:hypothetical protein ACIBM3_33265 [Rhodococcus erythropolis]|uniref:hypothetical protein n=1 Tax=Rhodococcus erythropolis TaxID=1833 RepID=UPI00379B2B67